MSRVIMMAVVLGVQFASVSAVAQPGRKGKARIRAKAKARAKARAEAKEAKEAAAGTAEEKREARGPKLEVVSGPAEGDLSGIAVVQVPDKFGFVETKNMPMLNKLTGNLHNPRDVGALLAPEGWIVFFNWDPVGYVSDEDKDDLDADELLDTFKESEEASNEARAQQGFDPMFIDGWQTEPFYDPETNNMTWALRNRVGAEGQGTNINHEVRLLGRRGVMSATLVASPQKLGEAVQQLGGLLSGFSFKGGHTYAEYTEGDKMAAYGLAGLVLGGGALLAAKTGLLAKLGKFIKVIVVAGAALVAGLFKKIKAKFSGEA